MRHPSSLSFILFLAAALWCHGPDPARAQEPAVQGTASRRQPADSVRLLRQARDAQREFEAFHRAHLPEASRVWRGPCDERLGTICLRFDGDEGWEPGGGESPDIVEARSRLLAVLAGAAKTIPADRWILGQRIRYLGEGGRWEKALALARGCRGGPPWWCPALQGYVLHRAGRTLEASEAFGEALSRMDSEMAGRWRDPGLLLDYATGRWLKDPRGLSREEALRRFWRLADPLFLTPGNERFTEHLARRFGVLLLEDSDLTLGIPWGRSLEALLLRYGFVAGWERIPAGMTGAGSYLEADVVEHHHPDSRGLLPPLEALKDPSGLPPGVWVPLHKRPTSASAPLAAPLVVEGRAQTAVLRRGGDILVLAAYEVPSDTLLEGRGGEGSGEGLFRAPWQPRPDVSSKDTLTGLYLLADTGAWAPLSVLGGGGRGRIQLLAPPGGYLLSMEVWSPGELWASRVRHGIRVEAIPPDLPALSDLLLLEVAPDLPESLREARPRLLTASEVRRGGRVTVAWEVYGLGYRQDVLTFGLTLEEDEVGVVRRMLNRIGLFRTLPPLKLSWTEPGPSRTGVVFRAVDLELPEVGPGLYTLRLEMEMPYRGKVVSRRSILVR